MTQISNEQLDAMSQRIAAKVEAFYDGFTDDERQVIDVAIRRLVAGAATDTQGYRAAEYEDDPYGNKARRGSRDPEPHGGGGAAVPAILLGLPLVIVGGGGHQAPGEYA